MLKCRLAYSLLLIRSKGFKRATNCFLVKVDDLLKELFHLMPFFHLYSDSFQFKKLFFFFFTMIQHISTQIQQSVSDSVNHLSLYLHLSPPASHFRGQGWFCVTVVHWPVWWLLSHSQCGSVSGSEVFFFLQSNEKRETVSYEGGARD